MDSGARRSDDEHLVGRVRQLIDAENERDRQAANLILAPDFRAITRAGGAEQDRTSLLAAIAKPPNPAIRRQLADRDCWVHRSEDLGIVGSVVTTLDASSEQPPRRFRNLHVFSLDREDWRCVAWQVTELKEPVEDEVALLIRRPSQAVLNELAELTEIGSYRLVPTAAQRLRDRYFDTQNRDLALRHIALRVRESNGECLLALKGPTKGTRRLEIEEAWSSDAVARVRAKLEGEGIELRKADQDRPDASDGSDEQAETLARLGLTVIQTRETERTRRKFSLGQDVELAELDIDSVVYKTADYVARLQEVEIERKDQSFDLVTAKESLIKEVPALVPWPHSKLAVGKAIEHVMAEGGAILAPDGTITPAGYDEIERTLSRKEV